MSPRLQTVAGVVVYVSTLVALVVLLIQQRPVDDVMLLAGPVVAALLIGGRVDAVHDVVRKIDTQTNGVLDSRIAQGVAQALDAHGQVYIGRHDLGTA